MIFAYKWEASSETPIWGKSDRLSVERMLRAERLDNGYALRHQELNPAIDNGYAQEYITQDQVADLEDKLENCQQDCKRFTVENHAC